MGMTVVLSMEPSSEMFDARVLTVENDPILISRSSKERGAEKNNAFFNCKVSIFQHISYYRDNIPGTV